jgi:type IV secretion system protein VirB4
MLGDKYFRIITVKNSPDTLPASMADLDALPFENRYTVRWIGMEHAEGMRKIERQLADWNMLGVKMIPMLINYMMKSDKQTTNIAANAMAEDAQEALYSVRRDELTIGYANLNVMVWDSDPGELDRKVQKITDLLNRKSLVIKTYGISTLDTWLGTIPGHIYADPRRPIRTSVNLSHFMPYSSVWAGEKWNKQWNCGPLLIATTDGSTPFWLNLHRGDLGHCLILGPSGNGKTTVLNCLAVGGRQVADAKVCMFTIKGGGEIVTRLLGGVSYQVGEIGGAAIGFQPLLHADEPNERIELIGWVLDLLRAKNVEITTDIEAEISAAMDDIGANPPKRRTLTHLSSYLNTPEVKAAIQYYTLQGGNYGRLLDDDEDRISLSDVLSLDMTELLKKKEIAPHVLAHLFRYIERRIFTGNPVLLIIDEAWKFLGDVMFSAKFDEWLRAARSRNVAVVFATQNMRDAFDDTIGKVLADAENVPNIILLPNDRAASEKGRAPYEKLGFHERDIQIVANAIPKRHYYFTSTAGRRLFDLNLGPIGIALCASTDDKDVQAARRLYAKHPDEFRERFFEGKGLKTVADFIRMEKGALPVVAMAAE